MNFNVYKAMCEQFIKLNHVRRNDVYGVDVSVQEKLFIGHLVFVSKNQEIIVTPSKMPKCALLQHFKTCISYILNDGTST